MPMHINLANGWNESQYYKQTNREWDGNILKFMREKTSLRSTFFVVVLKSPVGHALVALQRFKVSNYAKWHFLQSKNGNHFFVIAYCNYWSDRAVLQMTLTHRDAVETYLETDATSIERDLIDFIRHIKQTNCFMCTIGNQLTAPALCFDFQSFTKTTQQALQ